MNKYLVKKFQKRCDFSFTLGFKEQLLGMGRRDNSEEVLNKLFETNIKSNKLNNIERGLGRASASTLIGLGIGGVVHGISKALGSKHGGKIGIAAALVTGIGNFIWQNSN